MYVRRELEPRQETLRDFTIELTKYWLTSHKIVKQNEYVNWWTYCTQCHVPRLYDY